VSGGQDRLRVVGGRVLHRRAWIDADVVVEGGVVAGVEPRPGVGEAGRGDATTLEAAGSMVVPGLVDLQINGGFGHDLTSAPESVWAVGAELPRTGVTAFLPTIVSSPPGIVRRALEILSEGPPAGYAGATPLGVHCEGPMLAASRRGAHEARHLRPPTREVIEGWSAEAGVRIVTLAPELEGADAIVRELRERGVVVSIGHSDATFEEAIAGFDAGITAGTHLFNAMSGFHHREPGVAGALLARADVVAGIIVDGAHVRPGAVAVAWRAKGPRGTALVTDAVAPMGMDAGTGYRLGASEVVSDGVEVRDAAGALAGSMLTLDAAVRNIVVFAGVPPEEAIATATETPAAMIGESRRGVIEPDAVADLTLLDADLLVVATVVGGRVVFDRRRGKVVG
jgi:N-acetylglucosamine-6-phosphate deacetylase